MKKAFTIIELIFVIVIIGILAAIAIPKLSSTVDFAYVTKAKSTVAAVRSALATERQKLILRGITNDINYSTLGENYQNLLTVGVKECSSAGCGGWETTSTDSANPEFTFHAPDGEEVTFELQNNRLICTAGNSICSKYED